MSSFSINGILQAEYQYDFAGRQAIRRLVADGVTIHSVFDSEDRRIAEYNEATGALIREYVCMGWDPVAMIEGGVISYVRADHIGRPVFATNSTGAKVWTASYLPFGGVRTSTGTAITARFPGQWFQTESGLHQNWMRDYDQTTGRYLQADPLGLIDAASVYGYVKGNPGRWIDPRGESVTEVIIGGAIAGLEWSAAIAGAGIVAVLGVTLYPSTLGDGTLPDERAKVDPIPWPMPKKGYWSCTCRAAKNGRSEKNCPDGPDFATGHGVGKERSTAIKIAEKAAKQTLGAASVHHVPCKCTGPKGEKYNRGG